IVSWTDISGNVGNSRLCAAVPACTKSSEHSAADARMAAHHSCPGGTLCRRLHLETAAERFASCGSRSRAFDDPGNNCVVESPLSAVVLDLGSRCDTPPDDWVLWSAIGPLRMRCCHPRHVERRVRGDNV